MDSYILDVTLTRDIRRSTCLEVDSSQIREHGNDDGINDCWGPLALRRIQLLDLD